MTSRRFFGIIFILLAVLLTLAFLGQMPEVFRITRRFFNIFTGRMNGSQVGEVTGHIIYWIFHVGATIALWSYGLKWVRKKPKI